MTRTEKLVETFCKNQKPGWFNYKLPRIGPVAVSCMPAAVAEYSGMNQCWIRLGTRDDHSDELRGPVERVAKEIIQKHLKAPSKAVRAASEAIRGISFEGLRCEEMAAMLDLDEDTTFKAMDYLEERFLAVNKGAEGWFKP